MSICTWQLHFRPWDPQMITGSFDQNLKIMVDTCLGARARVNEPKSAKHGRQMVGKNTCLRKERFLRRGCVSNIIVFFVVLPTQFGQAWPTKVPARSAHLANPRSAYLVRRGTKNGVSSSLAQLGQSWSTAEKLVFFSPDLWGLLIGRFLPIFTDFSDSLGRLQVSKATL